MPLTPNAVPVNTESGAVITAFSVRLVLQVEPDAIYAPRPGRVHGVHVAAVLNVPAGASVSAHGATTLMDLLAVPALSRPPFDTVSDTAYVPALAQVG